MIRTRTGGLAALAALGGLISASAVGAQDAPDTPQYPNIRISGRLHLQGYALDNDDVAPTLGPRASFFIRRARIEAVGDLTERISFVIQPSFENAGGREPNLRLRDAYITVRLSDAEAPVEVAVKAGQFKRPFSRYELTSSNNLPSIERGAGRGMLGVSYNQLFEQAGFLAHDLGAGIQLGTGPFALEAGVFNGEGESRNDANDAKSFGARATLALARRLSLGASVFSHEGLMNVPATPPATGEVVDSSFRNTAFELDAAYGRPGDPGFFLLLEGGQGERFDANTTTMRGGSAIAAFKFPLAGRPLVEGVEPGVRADIVDPDVDADDDRVQLYSAIVGFYFASRSQFRLGYEWQRFDEPGRSSIHGLRTALTVAF